MAGNHQNFIGSTRAGQFGEYVAALDSLDLHRQVGAKSNLLKLECLEIRTACTNPQLVEIVTSRTEKTRGRIAVQPAL